jgi:hypothetical protein
MGFPQFKGKIIIALSNPGKNNCESRFIEID